MKGLKHIILWISQHLHPAGATFYVSHQAGGN